MKNSKELLIVRYISLVYLIFSIILSKGNSSLGLAIILVIILNNNLRIFYFKKKIYNKLSIILEFILIILSQYLFKGAIALYLIGTIIDIYSLEDKKSRNILLAISLALVLVTIPFESKKYIALNLVFLCMIYILMKYIEKLYESKILANELYDKLRISEEELKESKEELESCLESIEEITLLKERNRISREIHDSVGHALTTAMIQLSAMETIGKTESKVLSEMAGNLREFINESFQDVKRAVRELKPDEYDNVQGPIRIQEVCKNFERLTGVKVKVTLSKGEWNLSTKQVSNLLRITQEILSNSLRHGKANMVNIIMNFDKDDFVISFKDNGVGAQKIEEKGVGLKSIRERISELNGTVFFKSKINEGFFTKIIIQREKEK
ncbi:MAG: sensor histidine kinase [Clostridium sp.]|nr:sensor histidine kinase [Clostridium sp.]